MTTDVIARRIQEWKAVERIQGNLYAFVENPVGFSTAIQAVLRELETIRSLLHIEIKVREDWLKLKDEELDYPDMKKDATHEIGLLKHLCGCKECKGDGDVS